ncbi:hypothetical protein LTS08_000717 [Lithohypha guttulata]|nr:hypothetical protein LTS08_000717 [Lithohypha guttulata]
MAAAAVLNQPAPLSSVHHLPKYQQAKESRYELDWADLVTLDLSKFEQLGGKQELAKQLKDAVHNIGFFYITNFGLSQEEVDYQFAIGREVFALPMEEKLKYRADLENGNYNGYRPLGAAELYPGLRDNVEMYNLFKFLPELERTQPSVITENKAEIERFQRHIAENVVQKLLVLVSIILELPDEGALSEGHRYSDISDCHLRYMIYRARSPEENAKFNNIYSKGHTDFGSLTLLFRQPIAALQVLTPAGDWRYVKPHPGSITVNIADVLQFWTNGYLKSSIHRVVAPPPDQAHIDRLGLLYFLRPGHDLTLKTLDSPLLRRLGLDVHEDDAKKDGIKAGDWVRARVKGNFDKPEDEKEKEVIGGIKAKYWD